MSSETRPVGRKIRTDRFAYRDDPYRRDRFLISLSFTNTSSLSLKLDQFSYDTCTVCFFPLFISFILRICFFLATFNSLAAKVIRAITASDLDILLEIVLMSQSATIVAFLGKVFKLCLPFLFSLSIFFF